MRMITDICLSVADLPHFIIFANLALITRFKNTIFRSLFVHPSFGVLIMRKSLIASVAVLAALSISTADAADKKKAAPKKAKPTAAASAPVVASTKTFNWTGAYIGANAGYSMVQSSKLDGLITSILTSNGAPVNLSKSNDGFSGGIHAGYNYTIESIVLGLEADSNFIEAKKTTKNSFTNSGVTYNTDVNIKSSMSGSVRTRIGYSFDRVLPYVTAGMTVADTKVGINNVASNGSLNIHASTSKTVYGYAVGAGVEYAITDNLIGRVEYIYSDYGDTTYTSGSDSAKLNLSTHNIRAGLAYKF